MAGQTAGSFHQSLAQRLCFARRVSGMSQRDLAAAIGSTLAQVRRYEAGESVISAATMLRIAVALDAPLGWLYGIDDGDHWPDTLLATIVQDPEMPALVGSFARITDVEARQRLLGMAQQLGGHERRPSKASGAPKAPGRRGRRAMLVDDASDVLVVVGAFLSSGGYDVLRVGGAQAALEHLRDGERVDVLVTDYVMPGMDGLELLRQATALRPGLACVMITAYAGGFGLAGGEIPGTVMLAKPFARAELLKAVETVCNRAEAGPDQG